MHLGSINFIYLFILFFRSHYSQFMDIYLQQFTKSNQVISVKPYVERFFYRAFSRTFLET